MPGAVLVVDDDPAFLALTLRLLGDLNFERVVTAANAAEAIAVAQQARPSAMLVDVGLPDRSGIELAEELGSLPWSPRVVLTSSDSEAYIAIPDTPGFPRTGFIAKQDLESEALRRALVVD